MNIPSQSSALESLKQFADNKRQSVIIYGIKGSGKTHLARQYAEFLHISDFYICEPKIDTVRTIMYDRQINYEKPLVICIENIETGVVATENSLLKFIEEPPNNTYIILTTSNIKQIKDTILSRCFLCTIAPPTKHDLELYLNTKYYKETLPHHFELMPYVKSFSQIDTIMLMTIDNVAYIKSLKDIIIMSEAISSITWKLQHYADNKDTPLDIVLEYIIATADEEYRYIFIECFDALQKGNMAKNVVLNKYIFDYKYREQHPELNAN